MPEKLKRDSAAEDFISNLTKNYVDSYPDLDALAIEFLMRMTAASNARAAASARFFRSHGMERTAGRFAVLRVLFLSPEREMAFSEISAGLDVTPANITILVDGLEKDGLAVRVPHSTDRRSSLVRLTTRGEEVCAEIVPALGRLLGDMCAGFSESEKSLLIKLMKRLKDNSEACFPKGQNGNAVRLAPRGQA